MTTQEQIHHHIAAQAEPKRADMDALHQRIMQALPHVPPSGYTFQE